MTIKQEVINRLMDQTIQEVNRDTYYLTVDDITAIETRFQSLKEFINGIYDGHSSKADKEGNSN